MSNKLRKLFIGKKNPKRTAIVRSGQINFDESHTVVKVGDTFLEDDNFFKLKKLGDIVKVKGEGDLYKGVIVSSGETKLVARITGEAFLFPVAICSSDAERKIKEAYLSLNSQAETIK